MPEKMPPEMNVLSEKDRQTRLLASVLNILYPLVTFVDLTGNRVESLRAEGFNAPDKALIGTYDDFILIGADDTPEGPERDAFLRLFSRENMLKAYAEGRQYVQQEHRHRMGDGKYHWMRSRIVFSPDAHPSVMGLALSTNIDEEIADRETRAREAAMISGLSSDYNAVFYADPFEDRVTVIRRNDRMKQIHGEVPLVTDFDGFITGVSTFAAPEDASRLRKLLSRESILKRFSGPEGIRRDYITGLLRKDHSTPFYHIKLIRVDDPIDPNRYGIITGFADMADSVRKQLEYEQELENRVREQTEQIRDTTRRIMNIQGNVIDSMATLVESRDICTGNHVRNTRHFVSMLVDRLREQDIYPELQDDRFAGNIKAASVLHDIGKIFISDVILNKPGKLDAEEFRTIQNHTVLGKEIVEEIFVNNVSDDVVAVICDIVYSHHERWDGHGYPLGLKGNDIPLPARIMAVADVFDALISERSYKAPYTVDQAIEIILAESGKHFDTRVVNAFVSLREEIDAYLLGGDDTGSRVTLSGAYTSMVEAIQNRTIAGAFVEDYELAVVLNPEGGDVRLLYISDTFRALGYNKVTDAHGQDFMCHLVSRVDENDREEMARALSPDGIRAIMNEQSSYTLNYRVTVSGVTHHMQLKLIRIGMDTRFNRMDVLAGVRDIENEIRRETEKLKHEQVIQSIISGIAEDYEAIFYAELDNDVFRVVREREAFVRHHPEMRNISTYTDFVRTAAAQVYSCDQMGLARHLRATQVRELLSEREADYFNYRRIIHNELQYYRVKLIRAAHWEECGALLIGVSNTDAETRREMEREQALRRARIDGLTGLLNRVTFEQETNTFVAEHTSRGTAMAYLDLDTFKKLNDTLGHAEGDRILELTAAELKAIFGENALLGRMGGDEFAVFLPSAEEESTRILMNSALVRVSERLCGEYPSSHISISAGCVLCRDEGMDFNDLRVLADREMYRSKLAGRNQLHIRFVTRADAITK